jgi:putative SOS response-associated peptidase YedK
MCNRYGYAHPFEKLRDAFSLLKPLRWAEGQASNLRFGDITISDMAPVIRLTSEAAELSAVRWAWKGAHGKPVFNFRSEGRDFGGSDRLLVPASCFYEFTGARSPKTRWTFTLADADLLMIAGVVQQGAFSLLTTAPGPDVAPYHDRQIVVLPNPQAWSDWGEGACLPPPLPAGTLRVA